MPLTERRRLIEREHEALSTTRQCRLLRMHRSGLYYEPQPESQENIGLMRKLDEQYLATPFYGVRRLTAWLRSAGHHINSKRVRRLMGIVDDAVMGWQTLYRHPRTTIPEKGHVVYPYPLKDLRITHRNQVWPIDITYIPMHRGFLYMVAIIDVHTRYVVGWSIANTMSAEWCAQTVEDAIVVHGTPVILNSDQGSPDDQSSVYK
jgi:putative transposase